MPFFSIVIPTYNSAVYLQNAINSITSQTFNNYEVVFIDGESVDGTLQIIEGLKINNTHIKLITEPDHGIYDAMNKGISLASGDWLYFLGSDDILSSATVLEGVFNEINNEKPDLVYGNVTGQISNTRYVYDSIDKVLSTGIHHQSIFYKKSLFDTLGKYDPFFKIAADYHFTLKVFLDDRYKTKYIDTDIANFGESGLSSHTFDYTFFSYHYKFLALNTGVNKLNDPEKCLNNSVYCCLYLAKNRANVLFAWKNLLFYFAGKNMTGMRSRIKILGQMLMWSIKRDK